MTLDLIFQIAILIMSVVVHEVSHGYAANWLGDPTAKYQGRLTLNPIKHLDLFGSIILPFILVISGANFIIGWAKPVPYNPYNLRNARWGEAMVAASGPLSNIALALIFGLALRFFIAGGFVVDTALIQITSYVVFINLLLAVFNLVPIPPLDGSKILFSFLPFRMSAARIFLERWGFFIVLVFIFFFWGVISPIIVFLFRLVTGVF